MGLVVLMSGLSCSKEQAKAPGGAPAGAAAVEERPVTEMQMLVVNAFYDNDPVTYQPEPPDVTAARQHSARERIKTLTSAEIRAVGDLLRDENVTLTECAAKALELIGGRAAAAVPQLIKSLDRSGADYYRTRIVVLRTLGGLKGAAVPAKERLQAYVGNDAQERAAAEQALAQIVAADPAAPGAATRQALLDARMIRPGKQSPAITKLIAQGRAAVPDLVQILQSDPDASLRRRAAGVLKLLGHDAAPAVPALIKTLADDDKLLVAEAVEALGAIGPDAAPAVGQLVEMIRSDGLFLPKAAMEAVGGIGPAAKDAVPALIERLQSGDSFDGETAAEALGKIGPAAVAAVPALQQAQKQSLVRDAAIAALARIQPDSDPLISGPPDNPADKDKPADPEHAVARAELFFATLKKDDLPALRTLLTRKARPNYGTGVGSFTLDPPPADGKFVFGKPRFEGDQVAVPVAIGLKEESIRNYLHMRSEFGQWHVYAIELAQSDGKALLIDFEQPDSFLPGFPFLPDLKMPGATGEESNSGEPANES